MRAAPVLLLALLLAGCLEEAGQPPPAEANGTDAAGKSPLKIPDVPALELPYQRDHVFDAAGAGRVDVVRVPDGTTALVFRAGVSGGLPGEPAVSIRLVGPSGQTEAECSADVCEATLPGPAPGRWALAYAGIAERNATVSLRAETTAPTPSTPPVTLTPVPPTLPIQEPEPSGARQLLYANKRELEKAFAAVEVPPGLHAIRFEVQANESVGAAIDLLDPRGEPVATCAASGCARNVVGPEAGEWRVRFAVGVEGEVFVRVWGYEEPPVFENLYRKEVQAKAYTNRTDLLTVQPGVREIRGSILLETQAADPGNPPRVVLFDPSWTPALECRETCSVAVQAQPGLWHVVYMGNGSGTLLVNLTLAGIPERPMTSIEVYRGSNHYPTETRGDAVGGYTVPRGFSRMLFTVDWGQARDPASTAVVELRDPSGVVAHRCARLDGDVCEVTLERPMAGLWEVTYAGRDAASDAKGFAKIA